MKMTKTRMKRTRTGIKRRLSFLLLLCGALASARQLPTSPDNASPPVAPGDNNTRLITTRSILGRVLSKAGAPVPGAVVLLKDGKTLQVRSYIAQQGGEYHFFGLSTDVNYTLRAEDKAMTSKVKTISVFDSHKQVKLDLKLIKKIERSK